MTDSVSSRVAWLAEMVGGMSIPFEKFRLYRIAGISKTRLVNCERNPAPRYLPRGVAMTRQQHDDIRRDPHRLRTALAEGVRSAPELFPAGFDRGYRLYGFDCESRKLPAVKVKLREIVTADGTSFRLRHRLHDQDHRGTGRSPAPGGARRPRPAVEGRLRP